MKITRLQQDNILGIASVDIKLDTTVALFCGANGSGKSSIRDGVALAIAQQPARNVAIKKDFAALVRDGAKAGGALITIDDDPEQSFAFNMPAGIFSGPEISESMRVALDGQRFASMKPDERRTFLFDLTKCKPNTANVKERMLARQCEEAKVDAVLPMLRTGFPGVCDFAKGKATEAKGSWRTLTGETYGAKKAEGWKSEKPAKPEADAAALQASLGELDAGLAIMNQSLGTITAAQRTASENAAKRASLSAAVAKVPAISENLALAKKELAEYEPTVLALRERAKGAATLRLVDELASFIATTPIPTLGKEYEEKGNVLLRRYEATGGDYGIAAGKVDTEAQASLPEHEKGLTVMKNRVTNLQRDLDSATQAKGQFDALAPEETAEDHAAAIAEVQDLIAKAKADRALVAKNIGEIEAVTRQRADADAKTKGAAGHHADVLAWTVVADALAPDGIPSELLMEALAPVNTALQQAAMDTEWMTVEIGAAMAISAAGRPYQMLSESEQWRTDAMIAQVVSEISGLKLLLLDRVDVLDLTGRVQLLEWLDTLAMNDLLDTALLFATLKALPQGLPETIDAYWIEDGVIAGRQQQAAA